MSAFCAGFFPQDYIHFTYLTLLSDAHQADVLAHVQRGQQIRVLL